MTYRLYRLLLGAFFFGVGYFCPWEFILLALISFILGSMEGMAT